MIISQVNAKPRIDRDVLLVDMEFLLIILLYEKKTGTTPVMREQCRPTLQLACFFGSLRFASSSGAEIMITDKAFPD
jgi:hypothetical protein